MSRAMREMSRDIGLAYRDNAPNLFSTRDARRRSAVSKPRELERAGRRRLDQRAASLALLAAHLLVVGEPAQLQLHLADLSGLRRRDGREQPRHRVERPVGVVARERLLVRPLVATVAQLLHQRAF